MSTLDQLGFSFQPQRRVWTVRELVGAVRTALEREYTDVWIEGEISNLRPAESGHLYFTLKDGDAQLSIVMFRMQARLLRFRAENGMHIVARGRISVYEGRGQMQLVAEYLEPKGAGALQVAFEQLKARLEAEGLFDRSRKKPIPALPKGIGIVTSPRGAAVQDMLNILRRRHAAARILIYPAQVQGEPAASEVTAGLKYFNRSKNVDVIVIARGGGSAEDLAAFNNEGLARAIAASAIPIISAVGHETDFTIADFVADLRAPTPSAAAELVIAAHDQLARQVRELHRRLEQSARYRVLSAKQRLLQLSEHGVFREIRDTVRRRQQRVDDLTYRLSAAPRALFDRYRRRLEVASTRVRHHDLRRVLAGMRRELDARSSELATAARGLLSGRHGRFDRAAARLEALSPLAILERGYALVFDAEGKLVKDASQVETGDELRIKVAKGEIKAKVSKQ